MRQGEFFRNLFAQGGSGAMLYERAGVRVGKQKGTEKRNRLEVGTKRNSCECRSLEMTSVCFLSGDELFDRHLRQHDGGEHDDAAEVLASGQVLMQHDGAGEDGEDGLEAHEK